jgi:hypothetical protein
MYEILSEPRTTTAGGQHYHAVVWLDHHEARIVHFNHDEVNEDVVKPSDWPQHLHVRSGSPSGTRVTAMPAFICAVAEASDDAQTILMVGSSTAKAEFLTFLPRQSPRLASRIVEVGGLARVSDKQCSPRAAGFCRGGSHDAANSSGPAT